MMDVLVEAEREPKEAVVSFLLWRCSCHFVWTKIFEAAEQFWASLDSVHREVNHKIENRKPPHGRREEKHDEKRAEGVHGTVQGKRRFPSSFVEFALHVVGLQNEVGDVVLEVEG